MDWMEAVEVIIEILGSYDSMIPAETSDIDGFVENMRIAKSLLLFLGRIIRAAKDKRCFVHFEVCDSWIRFELKMPSILRDKSNLGCA